MPVRKLLSECFFYVCKNRGYYRANGAIIVQTGLSSCKRGDCIGPPAIWSTVRHPIVSIHFEITLTCLNNDTVTLKSLTVFSRILFRKIEVDTFVEECIDLAILKVTVKVIKKIIVIKIIIITTIRIRIRIL